MVTERIQRHIDRLLDEADEAVARKDWATVLDRVEHVLSLDPEHRDALALRAAAERGLAASPRPTTGLTAEDPESAEKDEKLRPLVPDAFVGGRYHR